MSFLGAIGSDISSTIGGVGGDLSNALGIGGNTHSSNSAAPAQIYRNQQVVNNRHALFQFYIRQPGKKGSVQKKYTLPISPANLKYSNTAMVTFYDTQGFAGYPSNSNTLGQGVQRIVDQYGVAPLVVDIEGTTGWQKHLVDGYKYTGLTSVQDFLGMINGYLTLNAVQSQNQKTDFFTLEFYDYFRPAALEIVPVGPQILEIDKNRPLYYNYKFHFVATRVLSLPTIDSTSDPILGAFQTAISTAESTVSTFVGGVSSLYKSATSVMSSIL